MKKLLSLLILGLLGSSQLYAMEKITKKRAHTVESNNSSKKNNKKRSRVEKTSDSDEEISETEEMKDVSSTNNEKVLIDAIKKADYIEISNLLQKIPNLSKQEYFKPFITAIETGDIKIVNIFLENNVNVNHFSKRKYWPLVEAVRTGNLKIVQLLDSRLPNLASQQRDAAFVTACALDHLEIATYLISKDVNIDAIMRPGFLHFLIKKDSKLSSLDCIDSLLKGTVSALGLASYCGYTNIVKLLIDKKVNVNHACCVKNTPLSLAIEGNCDEIIDLLLENGAIINCPRTVNALSRAIERGRLDLVKRLSESPRNKTIIAEDETVFETLMACGNSEIKSILMPLYNQNYTPHKRPLFRIAAYYGNKELMERFRPSKCSTESFYSEALIDAIQANNLEMANYLLSKGANPNYEEKPSALIIAFDNKNVQMIELLLDHGAVKPEYFFEDTYQPDLLTLFDKSDKRRKENTENFLAACKAGNIELAKGLIRYATNVDEQTLQSIFKEAIKNKNIALIKLLLENAREAISPMLAYTANYAAKNGLLDLINVLPREYNIMMLHEAIKAAQPEVVKTLINFGINVTTVELEKAKPCGNAEIIEMLETKIAKQNESLDDFFTAIATGNCEVVKKFLLEDKGRLLVSNSDKMAPLEVAVSAKQLPMTRLLLEFSAKKYGIENAVIWQKALILAIKQKSLTLIKCLLEQVGETYKSHEMEDALALALSGDHEEILKEIQRTYRKCPPNQKGHQGKYLEYHILNADIKKDFAANLRNYLKMPTKRELLRHFFFSSLLNFNISGSEWLYSPNFAAIRTPKLPTNVNINFSQAMDIQFTMSDLLNLSRMSYEGIFLVAARSGSHNIMQALLEDKEFAIADVALLGFICAAAEGNLKTIEWLVSKDLKLTNIIAVFALKVAILAGHVNVAEYIIDQYPEFLETENIKKLLPGTFKNDSEKMLSFLIRKYNKDLQDLLKFIEDALPKIYSIRKSILGTEDKWLFSYLLSIGWKPLRSSIFNAIQFCNHELCAKMLEKTENRKLALDNILCNLGVIKPEILTFLIEQGANVNAKLYRTAYMNAVANANWKAIPILLRAGADKTLPPQLIADLASKPELNSQYQAVIASEEKRQNDLKFKLFKAIFGSDINTIRVLVKEGVNLDCYSDELIVQGYTPLIAACIARKMDVIKFLLSEKVDVNKTERDTNHTPLYFAIGDKNDPINEEIVKILLEHAAYDDNFVAITRAVELNAVNIVKQIMAGLFDKVPTRNAAFMAAARFGNLELTKALLDQGAFINMTDKEGITPLMLATKSSNAELVQFLIDNGANMACKDSKNDNALIYANGNEVIIAILTEALNSKVLKQARFTDAIKANDFNAVRDIILSNTIEINFQDELGETALMHAVNTGNHYIVSYLLTNGAQANIVNNKAKSALNYAVLNDDLQILKILLTTQIYNLNLLKNAIVDATHHVKTKEGINTSILDTLVAACNPESKQEILTEILNTAIKDGIDELAKKLISDKEINISAIETLKKLLKQAIKTKNVEIIRIIGARIKEKRAFLDIYDDMIHSMNYKSFAALLGSFQYDEAYADSISKMAEGLKKVLSKLAATYLQTSIDAKKINLKDFNPSAKNRFEEMVILSEILADESTLEYLENKALNDVTWLDENSDSYLEDYELPKNHLNQTDITFASIFGHAEVIKKSGKKFHVKCFTIPDKFGRTPLMYAILYNNIECVKALLTICGSNGINLVDNEDNCALYYAIANGNLAIMSELFRNGAKITTRKLLHGIKIAAAKGYDKLVVRLLDKYGEPKLGLDWAIFN